MNFHTIIVRKISLALLASAWGMCWGIFQPIVAQQTMPDANADFVVSHQLITVEQGMASRDVKDAVMDTRGFMWLATSMGLNRYDGNNFLLFTKEKNGLLSDDVQVIIPHGNNRLIVQSFLRDNWAVDPEKNVNSFQVLDLNSYRIMPLKEAFPDLPFPEEQLLQIAEHGDSTLLFFRATPYEIWSYTSGNAWQRTFEFSQWNEQLPKQPLLFIELFNLNQREELLMRPIFRYNLPGYRISKRGITPISELKYGAGVTAQNGTPHMYYDPSAHGATLLPDERDRGFYRYTDENTLIRSSELGELPSISNQDWHIMASNRVGEFACVNPDFGLYLYTGGEYLQVMSREQLLVTSDIKIYAVYHDMQNNHWLCTSIGLIQVSVRPRIFTNHFTKSEFDKAGINQVRGIYVDPTGSAAGGEQIYANVWKKMATAPQIPLKGNNEEFSLIPLVQHADHLYAGLFFRWKNGSNVMQKLAFDYSPATGWAVHSLNDSLVLSGSSEIEGGIYAVNTRTGKSRLLMRSSSSIPNPTIVYRFVLTQKKGLVALAENGVFRLDGDWNIVEYWGPKGDAQHQLPISEFYDLHEDKQGVCWLATANQGLFRWEWNASAGNSKPVVRQFAMSEGLPALRLYRIEEDDRENLWVSTYNGLMRFDKKYFSAFNFYTKDGLSHNEFNRVSSFKASDGKMYFGGVNGLNAFDPKRVDEVYFKRSFPLQLLSIQRFSDESDSLVSMLADWYKDQSLTISHADRFLAVDFALLDYAQRPHRYAYMLEGVDTEWNLIEGGSVRISHLSYGNYTLRVKAQLENGQWNEQELRIPINVLVPLYLRWSFWLVFLAALVVVVWLYAIWRTRRLERQNQRLEIAVEERTQGLSKALKDRELLLMEIHHRVKINLQIVSDLLQLQKDQMKDAEQMAFISDGQSRVVSMALIHQNLYQNNDLTSIRFDIFLQSLTSQISELYSADNRAIVLEHNGGEFYLDIDTAIPLGLITNELITNSYKYAFDTSNEVRINVDLESLGSGRYKMTYRDFGPGLPDGVDIHSNKSLGMHLIYGLTHQLSGELHYSFDGGSVFEMIFSDSQLRSKQ